MFCTVLSYCFGEFGSEYGLQGAVGFIDCQGPNSDFFLFIIGDCSLHSTVYSDVYIYSVRHTYMSTLSLNACNVPWKIEIIK